MFAYGYDAEVVSQSNGTTTSQNRLDSTCEDAVYNTRSISMEEDHNIWPQRSLAVEEDKGTR